MSVCMTIAPLYVFFRYVVLTMMFITMVCGFKASSAMNINTHLDLKGHINANPMLKPEGFTQMNYYALKPVLFEKLHTTLSY